MRPSHHPTHTHTHHPTRRRFTVAGTETPVGFAQVPIDNQYMDPKTYSVAPQDDALFALPGYCVPSCGAGICASL